MDLGENSFYDCIDRTLNILVELNQFSGVITLFFFVLKLSKARKNRREMNVLELQKYDIVITPYKVRNLRLSFSELKSSLIFSKMCLYLFLPINIVLFEIFSGANSECGEAATSSSVFLQLKFD